MIAQFIIEGKVGSVILTPHPRSVGEAVVVEIHTVPERLPKQRGVHSPSVMLPWFVVFDKNKAASLRTGQMIRVYGTLVRSVSQNEDGRNSKKPYLAPMATYLWGEKWLVSKTVQQNLNPKSPPHSL